MSEKANTQSPSLPPTELLQQSQGHKDNSDSSTSSSQRSNGNTTPDATANANNNKNIGNFNANFFKNGPNVLNSDSTNGNNENTIDNSPDAIGTTNASNSKPPKDGLAKLDDDASKQPKKKGKAGRPRIHHDNQGSVSGSRTNPDGINVSVNEVIPKVWVICNFGVPVMAQIAIEALKKGDKVVLGCCPGGEDESKLLKRADRLWQRYPDRCIVVELDIKNYALCQSTISKTISQYGRIDIIVNCTNRVYVGALEEVEEWHMRAQLDQTFYGAVNMIQAALPYMRKQFFGHFVNITDVTGNIGTPALSLLSGAMHALEGYLEALACEVAPFNIKVTIVESPMEVSLLTIPVVLADQLPQYGLETPAGKLRGLLTTSNVFPERAFRNTILTVASLGGLENPPGRIVVGKEAIGQIKDKLALLSEDLEEFSAISISADYENYNIF